jgi:hypothetical protein
LAKRPIDIEQLLQWVYREELPKREIGGLDGWERDVFLLGTRVDTGGFGGEPGYPVSMGAPDPDALRIEWRVRQLPDVTWPDLAPHREHLMGELACYLQDGPGLAEMMHFEPKALVATYARLRSRPDWRTGPTRLKRVAHLLNGKPVVIGITAGHRYRIGAHCPLQLDPPAAEIASARAEYWAWRSALEWLADESWDLDGFAPTPPRAAASPWFGDYEKKPRILQSNLAPSPPPQKPLTTRTRRARRELAP